jgi:hypothetical protein
MTRTWRFGKIQVSINPPLDAWTHGDERDPKLWAWWKLFHLAYTALDLHGASTGHRFWLYTKTKAYDVDVFVDRRPRCECGGFMYAFGSYVTSGGHQLYTKLSCSNCGATEFVPGANADG